MIPGGKFDLYHGYPELIRFIVTGAAGASAATLQIAPDATSPTGRVDLTLNTSDGQISLLDVGGDCQVDCTFPPVPDVTPTGPRYFELTLTKGSRPKVVKTGTVEVHASVAA